jgi:uncharacterized beta-barrel protein YwiB (DUF1934 family)
MVIREVSVRIESVIQGLGASGLAEGKAERSNLQAVGYYHFENEKKVLVTYAEDTEGGRLTSELLIEGDSVRVKKQGAVVSDMLIKAGFTDRSVYSVPPYRFDLEIEGLRVNCTLDSYGGEIMLKYKMNIGGESRLSVMKIWLRST